MDIVLLVERIGESPTAALFGLITGLIFGIAAQRSQFCLRAAAVEFSRGSMGPAVTVWLLTFSTALFWVQGANLLDLFRIEDARMMAVPGSWSGAIIGGLIFGVGMVLARGCSGRLLVLAATGNLRSMVAGLIFAVVAQMSLHSWLSPLRDWFASLWITTGGHNLDILAALHLPEWAGVLLAVVLVFVALYEAKRNKMSARRLIFASGVGFSIAVGYLLTFMLSQVSFDPVSVNSATFTGPSANTLMFLLDNTAVLEFDVGLVPGVFIGSFLASIATRSFRFEWFASFKDFVNHFIGAILMGFGGVLAMGCTIGQGITGVSTLALGSFLAVISIMFGSALTMKIQYYQMVYEDEATFIKALLSSLVDMKLLPSALRSLEAV